MAGKRRLLAAVTDLGYVHVRRALGDHFKRVPAFSMLQARTAIKSGDIDVILCSLHFDESRMFDLLHFARHVAPGVPFICCRVLHSPLNDAVVEGVSHSAESQGALGFIDYHEMQRRQGTAAAAKAFCEAVMALLSGPQAASERRRQG